MSEQELQSITPKSFNEAAPVRIIGTECELDAQGSICELPTTNGGYRLNKEALEREQLEYVNGYLSNGARLHPDVGHVEYSTPECLGPKQATAAEFAGIILTKRLLEATVPPDEFKGLYRRSGTFKQTESDSELGATKGYHENYLIPRSSINNPYLQTVIPALLATRLWAMSGAVRNKGYVMSQKVWGMGCYQPIVFDCINRTSPGRKPMVMCREGDEVIGESQSKDWSRLEVRFADPGLSKNAMFVGKAATSMALRLVEHSQEFAGKLDCLKMLDYYAAAKLYASDLSLKATTKNIHGKRMSALDIQEILLDLAHLLKNNHELPADEVEALNIWDDLVTSLRNSKPNKVEYDDFALMNIDFAAKHLYLSKKAGTKLTNSNAPALQRDIMWERIAPSPKPDAPSGPGQAWWSRFPSAYVTSEAINDLISFAPAHTRAEERSDYIRYRRDSLAYVNWAQVRFIGEPEHYDLGSPYGRS